MSSTRTETQTLMGTPGCCCVASGCQCLYTGCIEMEFSIFGGGCSCTFSYGATSGTVLGPIPPTVNINSSNCSVDWQEVATNCGAFFNGFRLNCNDGVYQISAPTSFASTGPISVLSVQNSPFEIVAQFDTGYLCDDNTGTVTLTIRGVTCP